MTGLFRVCFLAVLAALCSCKTTHQDSSPVTGVHVNTVKLFPCPAKAVRCTMQFSPAVCSALEYDGQISHQRNARRARGSNPCFAKAKLSETVCAEGLKSSLFKRVSCVPDGTGGQCPAVPVMCTQEHNPTVCEAVVYGGQKLQKGALPRAWGSNECQARQALKILACNMNLKPKAMASVVCKTDVTEGQCPPKARVCLSSEKRVRCEASANKTSLVASAEGECMAKYELELMACRKDLKPEELSNVNCEEVE